MVRLQCIQSHMETMAAPKLPTQVLACSDSISCQRPYLTRIHCGMQTSMWRGEQVH